MPAKKRAEPQPSPPAPPTDIVVERRRITDLRPDPANANAGTERGLRVLDDSLGDVGLGRSAVTDKNGVILAGNKTTERAVDRGFDEAIIVHTTGNQLVVVQRDDLDLSDPDDPRARLLAYYDNRAGQVGLSWDASRIAADIEAGLDLGSMFRPDEIASLIDNAADIGGGMPSDPSRAGNLVEKFIVPPFSVLDARQGYWQDRKRAWIALGIRGELGRGGGIVPNGTTRPESQDGAWRRNAGIISGAPMPLDRKANGKTAGRAYSVDIMKGEYTPRQTASLRGGLLYGTTLHPYDGHSADGDKMGGAAVEIDPSSTAGTSIFDPVLCELAYRWFCPPGGLIINPTAGESVYGLVAGVLGHTYQGVEIRPEQIAVNEAQAVDMGLADRVRWIQGDGRKVAELVDGPADFVICCPPYYDLEIYSDDAADLSTAETYADFLEAYREIVFGSVAALAEDRFACFVVGDIRDKDGHYRNFVSDTIQAFLDAGCALYNEAILITAVGSLPLRAGRQFSMTRKLGKAHQNVLFFVKGDWRKAVKACGAIEVVLPEVADEP